MFYLLQTKINLSIENTLLMKRIKHLTNVSGDNLVYRNVVKRGITVLFTFYSGTKCLKTVTIKSRLDKISLC